MRNDACTRAFEGRDVERIARFGPQYVERLMNDPGIIRNRQKITSGTGNAQAWLPTWSKGPARSITS